MPPITPFVECPNCRKLLRVGVNQCPECHEQISPDYAAMSALVTVWNTAACRLAKDIRDRDLIMALVVVGESIWLYFMSGWIPRLLFCLTTVLSMLQLLVVANWYLRFGRFPLGDSEFVRASATVKRSAMLWTAILILQMAVILGMRSR